MIPKITDEQRSEALEAAKKVRRERAEMKQKLATGEMDMQALFEAADAGSTAASRMQVCHAIMAHPGYGRAKAEKLVQKLGIAESRRIGGLGRRQREALIAALEGKEEESKDA